MTIDVLSPGFGSAVNCHLGVVNLQYSTTDLTEVDTAGLHRGDAGAGAFTPFHNRKFQATRDIAAGAGQCILYQSAMMLKSSRHLLRLSFLTLLLYTYPVPFSTSLRTLIV